MTRLQEEAAARTTLRPYPLHGFVEKTPRLGAVEKIAIASFERRSSVVRDGVRWPRRRSRRFGSDRRSILPVVAPRVVT